MKWPLPSILPTCQRLRFALMLLVLAAMSTQQFVAQTHSHAVPGAHASVVGPIGELGSKPDDSCLLCQIAAHASGAAPTSVLQLLTAAQEYFFYVASFYEEDVPAVPAHAWQSRGPPVV